MKGSEEMSRKLEGVFKLQSEFAPTGDQPAAIDSIVEGLERGEHMQTLLGVTGSGKTFTMANVISKMNSEQVYELVSDWAKEFDNGFYEMMSANPNFAKQIFAIDRDVPKPRKDIAKWSDVKAFVSYFYDSILYFVCKTSF